MQKGGEWDQKGKRKGWMKEWKEICNPEMGGGRSDRNSTRRRDS